MPYTERVEAMLLIGILTLQFATLALGFVL
jgi:hypothetical protein